MENSLQLVLILLLAAVLVVIVFRLLKLPADRAIPDGRSPVEIQHNQRDKNMCQCRSIPGRISTASHAIVQFRHSDGRNRHRANRMGAKMLATPRTAREIVI